MPAHNANAPTRPARPGEVVIGQTVRLMRAVVIGQTVRLMRAVTIRDCNGTDGVVLEIVRSGRSSETLRVRLVDGRQRFLAAHKYDVFLGDDDNVAITV